MAACCCGLGVAGGGVVTEDRLGPVGNCVALDEFCPIRSKLGLDADCVAKFLDTSFGGAAGGGTTGAS